jgi:hypothetical protein
VVDGHDEEWRTENCGISACEFKKWRMNRHRNGKAEKQPHSPTDGQNRSHSPHTVNMNAKAEGDILEKAKQTMTIKRGQQTRRRYTYRPVVVVESMEEISLANPGKRREAVELWALDGF